MRASFWNDRDGIRRLRLLCLATAGVACAGLVGQARGDESQSAGGAPAQASRLSDGYAPRDVMIEMRDGVRLSTHIWSPKKTGADLPILFIRSPYGWPEDKVKQRLDQSYPHLARDKYIFVFQDIRGREGSEGEFVMLRPRRNLDDALGVDEGTDAYDTIEWLVQNVPGSNDRVGMFGVSYDAWLTVMAAIEPHPALKAVSEEASPADMFIGDDFQHNGALRLGYAFEYVAAMETGKKVARFKFLNQDTYDWYLRRGSLENIGKALGDERPSWTAFMERPNYDDFWRAQAVAPQLGAPRVPFLNTAGWFDAEDFYGPLKIYETLEKTDAEGRNYLVVGPWSHGGWHRDKTARRFGPLDFGSDTVEHYRKEIHGKWFAQWLKGEGSENRPEAEIFQTGCNEWRSYDQWPPKDVEARKLYLQADGALAFSPPERSRRPFDRFISDPSKPVPYRLRPIPENFGGGGWSSWHVDDQRFVHLRPDVLSWETEPLEEDIRISGDVIVELYASTTGEDAHWAAKLIDAFPDDYPAEPALGGYQLMIGADVVSARFRNGFERPARVQPGEVVKYEISLQQRSHCFKKGHRIMVTVQSTWFPLIARNPQRFLDNPYRAGTSDYQSAEHRVFHAPGRASNVILPVEDIEDRD